MKNKKNIILVSVILLILVVTLVCFLLLKENNEQKLNKLMQEIGKDFYENYYYDQVGKTDEERAIFLTKYKDIGIKINLDNLSRYNSEQNKEKIAKFVNDETKEECNKESTRIIIYPKENYGKTNYDLKVELSCGFEKK